MVGTGSAFVTDAYKAIADLLKSCPAANDFVSTRSSWLFAMADALEDADLCEDADSTRETALCLVRNAVSEVGGVIA
ncbi:hypothetical protein [Amycolatopsis benzoatilytica]|uniref:hypothetical protein n=1 Tax=Amycolatopsis benzoatilytica TaxID=346045 RepID=UPI0003A74246|nr:hypothetical protein [Amycolatopsis benzoatilytica]